MTLSRRRRSARADRFSRIIILWLPLLTAIPAFAGHGFMSAFGNIEWLPDPGRTPDSAWYTLDAVAEEGKLLVTRDPATKLQLYLSFGPQSVICSSHDFQPYRNAWDRLPPLAPSAPPAPFEGASPGPA